MSADLSFEEPQWTVSSLKIHGEDDFRGKIAEVTINTDEVWLLDQFKRALYEVPTYAVEGVFIDTYSCGYMQPEAFCRALELLPVIYPKVEVKNWTASVSAAGPCVLTSDDIIGARFAGSYNIINLNEGEEIRATIKISNNSSSQRNGAANERYSPVALCRFDIGEGVSKVIFDLVGNRDAPEIVKEAVYALSSDEMGLPIAYEGELPAVDTFSYSEPVRIISSKELTSSFTVPYSAKAMDILNRFLAIRAMREILSAYFRNSDTSQSDKKNFKMRYERALSGYFSSVFEGESEEGWKDFIENITRFSDEYKISDSVPEDAMRDALAPLDQWLVAKDIAKKDAYITIEANGDVLVGPRKAFAGAMHIDENVVRFTRLYQELPEQDLGIVMLANDTLFHWTSHSWAPEILKRISDDARDSGRRVVEAFGGPYNNANFMWGNKKAVNKCSLSTYVLCALKVFEKIPCLRASFPRALYKILQHSSHSRWYVQINPPFSDPMVRMCLDVIRDIYFGKSDYGNKDILVSLYMPLYKDLVEEYVDLFDQLDYDYLGNERMVMKNAPEVAGQHHALFLIRGRSKNKEVRDKHPWDTWESRR